MEKFISLLITLCMLLSIASCSFSTPKPTPPEPTSKSTAELTPESTQEPTPKSTSEPTQESTTVTPSDSTSDSTPVTPSESTSDSTPVTPPEPTLEPTKEPTPVTPPEPTLEPTKEPTPVTPPEPTLEPTKEPTPVTPPEPTLEPTKEPTPEMPPMPKPNEFQTYNNIDPYWDNLVRGLIYLDDRYLVEHPSDRVIPLGEAYYITYNVMLNYSCKKRSSDSQDFLDPNSDECKNKYKGPASYIAWYRSGSSRLSDEDLKRSITKIDLAIALAKISEERFKVVYPAKIEIKSELLNNLKDLSEQELYYVTKAINLGLIENNADDFKQVPLIQEEFEKVLVQFAMKFTTFAPGNASRQGSERFNLVTDPELLPSNYTWYPYILDSIPKEVYEYQGHYVATGDISSSGFTESKASPNHLYKIYGRYSDDSYANIRDFFDIILNVDYRTIDTDLFIHKLNQCLLYSVYGNYGEDGQLYVKMLTEYLDYIKENKIIISGKAIPLFPCLYENDFALMTFIKCKLEVNIISSDIENPKLCFFGSYMLGTDNDSVRYVEVPVGTIFERPELKVYIPPFKDGLV